MKSQFTKSAHIKYILFFIISLLLNVVPEAVAVFMISNRKSSNMNVLLICIAAAAVVCLISIIAKNKMRSAKWIIFIGIWYGLKAIPEVLSYILLAIAICTIIDDLVITPIYKHYSFQYKTNKTIDMRIEANTREKING